MSHTCFLIIIMTSIDIGYVNLHVIASYTHHHCIKYANRVHNS